MSRLALLLLLVMLPGTAGAFQIDANYHWGGESNRTWDRLSGNLSGAGGRALFRLSNRLRIGPEFDWLRGIEEHWDPLPDRSPDSTIGDIEAVREEFATGLLLRYSFALAYWPKRFWAADLYLQGGGGWSHSTVTLRDDWSTLRDAHNDVYWTAGAGAQWIFCHPLWGQSNRVMSIVLEFGAREHRLELDELGAGYGGRLSRIWYGRVGLGFFFME